MGLDQVDVPDAKGADFRKHKLLLQHHRKPGRGSTKNRQKAPLSESWNQAEKKEKEKGVVILLRIHIIVYSAEKRASSRKDLISGISFVNVSYIIPKSTLP